MPFCFTFAFFPDETISPVLDPSQLEQHLSAGLLSIALNAQKEICVLQKLGGAPLPREEILRLVNISVERAREFYTFIEARLTEDWLSRKVEVRWMIRTLSGLRRKKVTRFIVVFSPWREWGSPIIGPETLQLYVIRNDCNELTGIHPRLNPALHHRPYFPPPLLSRYSRRVLEAEPLISLFWQPAPSKLRSFGIPRESESSWWLFGLRVSQVSRITSDLQTLHNVPSCFLEVLETSSFTVPSPLYL